MLGAWLAMSGWWVLGALVTGVGFQQVGWLGHDIAHHNFTKNRRLNNALSYIVGNMLGGFSTNWWKNRHNTHHAITNVLDADPDIDNLPLFVWQESDLVRVPDSWFASMVVSYQEFYFVPWTSLLKLIWLIQSVMFVLTPSLQNKSFMKVLFWERLTLALNILWMLGVSWYTPSWTSFFGYYLLSQAVGGAGIALIVFMNHYALEMNEPPRRVDANFLELQLCGTRNVFPHPIMNWLSGGLNLQIEHHLFPTMPRNRLLETRPLVKQFCKDNGLRYDEMSYWDCLVEVERKLHRVSAAYLAQLKKSESAN